MFVCDEQILWQHAPRFSQSTGHIFTKTGENVLLNTSDYRSFSRSSGNHQCEEELLPVVCLQLIYLTCLGSYLAHNWCQTALHLSPQHAHRHSLLICWRHMWECKLSAASFLYFYLHLYSSIIGRCVLVDSVSWSKPQCPTLKSPKSICTPHVTATGPVPAAVLLRS